MSFSLLTKGAITTTGSLLSIVVLLPGSAIGYSAKTDEPPQALQGQKEAKYNVSDTSPELNIERLDHLVLYVANIEHSITFYHEKLGLPIIEMANGRKALRLGQQKINLHPYKAPYSPHAGNPATGAADFCIISHTPVNKIAKLLQDKGIAIIEGPVQRTGAMGPIMSIYLRDPDDNLIEISNYIETSQS